MSEMATDQRRALGATPLAEGRTRFRVWAPDRRQVAVAFSAVPGAPLQKTPLTPDGDGCFSAVVEGAPIGTRYRYCLDGGECFPDPCSRSQPEGPHGPSEVVALRAFAWSDHDWRGLQRSGQVLYELHVGTFTPEGTYQGVETKLRHLRELGVTALLLMPVNTFPGRFNWGYDGVSLFAPCPVYGRPEALQRLVDAAHRHGLGVVLDVVYNHLGPDGNYLGKYAEGYFSRTYKTDWGLPFHLEGPEARPVRDFLLQNVRMWIEDYHLDGLRLDATQNIYDASSPHILTELNAEARAAAGQRSVLIISENEPQDRRMVLPPQDGGHGGDLIWVDDFHHSARVALTGNSEAYCQDYCGTARELLSCVLRNSLYQGQYYAWQDKPRGTPLWDLPAASAVFYLQNHDQLANTLRGKRFQQLAGEDVARAMTVFLLLCPQTPMLFQGQEFFASSPFLYFVDHNEALMQQVHRGRDDFLSQFDTAKHALTEEGHEVPIDERARRASTLDWSEREQNQPVLRLHQDVLRLRRDDPLFAAQDLRRLTGAPLSERALVLRWQGERLDDARLLVLNLGPDLRLRPCPEPLLAAPPARRWRPLLSSQSTQYGGGGAREPAEAGPWHLPGQCALVLTTEEPTDDVR